MKTQSIRNRLRHAAAVGALLLATFTAVAGARPLHAAADCGQGNGMDQYDPISNGPNDFPTSTYEWATYEWQDAESDDNGGGASASSDWSFRQDYYVEGQWYTRLYCGWQKYPYPSFDVTQSIVDVEDGEGHPSGIPFSINNVSNGSDMYEWAHQREGYNRRQKYTIKDDGYWRSGQVNNYSNDTYAEGRWNNSPPEAALWDPQHMGFVYTTSSDASGGRLGDWSGYVVDYGY